MIGAAIRMRPSTRIHCVISLLSPTTKPLQGTRARHARSLLTTFDTYQHTPLHQSLSYNTQPSRKQVLNRAQPISQSPTASTRSQQAPSHSHSHPQTSRFSTKTSVMSSDDAYMSFLDKANADLNAGRASQQGTDTTRTETVDATTQIPTPLQSVDSYYISDTDEPFEPVALLWKGAKQGVWPNPGTALPLVLPSPYISTPYGSAMSLDGVLCPCACACACTLIWIMLIALCL